MLKLKNKHLVTGEELSSTEVQALLHLAMQLKTQRHQGLGHDLLRGKTLALLFDKPSLRTRMSFTVAMTELGGQVVESVGNHRKKEEPRDLARVLSGYCHGIMIRTFEQKDIEEMASAAKIPVINGLSDDFHPCQTLADLLTLQECFGQLNGLTVAYIGDGNNILQSLIPMSLLLGVKVNYCCPKGYEPNEQLLQEQLNHPNVKACSNPEEAVQGADAVYTDVWTSMGFESENQEREKNFQGFQVNEELLASSGVSHTKVMHCLPMNRGEEISDTLPESLSSLIFQQSENRLHAQKALLVGLLHGQTSGKQQEFDLPESSMENFNPYLLTKELLQRGQVGKKDISA